MSEKRKKQRRFLALTCACALVLCSLAYIFSADTPREEYPQMVDAAEQMTACMNAIKELKIELGIEPDDALDPNLTGMIGVSSSPITTTVGALEAKRTSTSPHMAALIVRLLTECGVGEGDKVACGFSGSFPALNIAMVVACDAIGATPVYITSVGASTYGANQPELTAPEMMQYLYEQGLISTANAAVTMGGGGDQGGNMMVIFDEDEEILQAVLQRLETSGLTPSVYEDLGENLNWRLSIYGDDVTCFVNVGGGVMNMGRSGAGYDLGNGIIRATVSTGEKDGMIETFLSQGTPAISLLNLKSLCTEYGIPYDSAYDLAVGEGELYHLRTYPIWIVLPGVAALTGLLLLYHKRR